MWHRQAGRPVFLTGPGIAAASPWGKQSWLHRRNSRSVEGLGGVLESVYYLFTSEITLPQADTVTWCRLCPVSRSEKSHYDDWDWRNWLGATHTWPERLWTTLHSTTKKRPTWEAQEIAQKKVIIRRETDLMRSPAYGRVPSLTWQVKLPLRSQA